MDFRASRDRSRRVHRRHSVPRDAELRQEDSRHRGGLSAPVCGRFGTGRCGTRRCDAGRRPEGQAGRAEAHHGEEEVAESSGRKKESGLMSKVTGSKKATQFTESVIREMTRLNDRYGGVNLSQGFPDFPAPDGVKEAACAAIRADINQYAVTWGARPLREAVAAQFTGRYRLHIVADEPVTVCW